MIDEETRKKALEWASTNAVGHTEGEGVVAARPTDNEATLKIAIKIIKQFEGCSLRAYPDPDSPLSKELSKHGILKKFIAGDLELPPYLAKLSGSPWTCGWGETKGVTQGTIYTQQEADSRLESRVKEFMQGVIKTSPRLLKASAEKLAAITSLAYNIGNAEYSTSTASKRIAKENWQGAAEAMQWFNKDNGVVVQGLVNRRKIEAILFLSVRG